MKSREKKYTLPQIRAWLEGWLFVSGSRKADQWNAALQNAIRQMEDPHDGMEAVRKRTGFRLPCTKCGLRPRMPGHTQCYPCKAPEIKASAQKRRRQHGDEVRKQYREYRKAQYQRNPERFLAKARRYRATGQSLKAERARRKKLADSYVVKSMFQNRVCTGDVPRALIETQRTIMQIKRDMRHE